MVQGRFPPGGHRFRGNRGNVRSYNHNRIQKNGQGDKDGDTAMYDGPLNGRSRGRGNRGQLRGRFQNNRNGTRWSEGNISQAVNSGAVNVHRHHGSALRVGDASADSTGSLNRISVHGWVTSNVGNQADRGAQSLLNYLDRKTNPNKGPGRGKVLIQKVCLRS